MVVAVKLSEDCCDELIRGPPLFSMEVSFIWRCLVSSFNSCTVILGVVVGARGESPTGVKVNEGEGEVVSAPLVWWWLFTNDEGGGDELGATSPLTFLPLLLERELTSFMNG
jgi:hypothetical protein